MHRRTQLVIIAAVVVALAAIAVVLAQLNRSDARVPAGSVAVTKGGKVLKTFSMEDVMALRSVTRKKTIRSSGHADESGTFTGVPLRVLLAAADPDLLGNASMVVTRASDGYVSSLSPDEVAGKDNVVLVYAKDGESLGAAADGGTGPFRLIIFSDDYGNRCTKWLNEIEIR